VEGRNVENLGHRMFVKQRRRLLTILKNQLRTKKVYGGTWGATNRAAVPKGLKSTGEKEVKRWSIGGIVTEVGGSLGGELERNTRTKSSGNRKKGT